MALGQPGQSRDNAFRTTSSQARRTADELIDSYVADVVLLLPRKQRRDVAQELRMLLREEAGAAASGQAARLPWRRCQSQRNSNRALSAAPRVNATTTAASARLQGRPSQGSCSSRSM